MVLGDDIFGGDGQGHFHILIPVHGVIVIEFFNVQGEEYGRGRQNGAVDEALDCRQNGAVGCGNAGEVKFVFPNRDTDPMGRIIVGPGADHRRE